MKPIMKIAWVETKLFMRESQTMFFTFVFPLLMLVVFASINEIDGESQNRLGQQSIAAMTTGFAGMVVAITALSAMPTTIAHYREHGILRRLQATPLSPAAVVGGQVAVQLLMTAAGLIMLLLSGILFYGLEIPASIGFAFLGLLLGSIGLFSVGFLIAAFVSTTRSAQVVGQTIFFPMIFLSGATFPRDEMPDTLLRIGDILPLTHAVELVQGLWFDNEWNLAALAVLAGFTVVGSAVGIRRFRWQ